VFNRLHSFELNLELVKFINLDNMQHLLLTAATALPILALIYVTALFAHKLYINVR